MFAGPLGAQDGTRESEEALDAAGQARTVDSDDALSGDRLQLAYKVDQDVVPAFELARIEGNLVGGVLLFS
ncbi:MAG: hypothetical protein ACJ8AH_04405 [Stellaceae bacterium]